jgi:hypothetical protein
MTTSAPAATYETVHTIGRDRWGRPLVIPPGGGKPIAYTRCTTYVSCLEDTYNLGKWQMRMVARGLSIREDLLLRVNSLGPQPDKDDPTYTGWRDDMDRLTDQAVEAAKASAGANIGTALHALTERIDRGQRVEDVPREYQKHLKAYRDATATFTAVEIERFMVNDHLQVGGTPDRILKIDNHDQLIIGDIKTGSVDYGMGKIAMQLAMYAHSDLYNPEAGERSRPYNIDQRRGLIIALDAGTGECQLHWVDLEAGWEAIQLCTQVRAWRARKNLDTPYEQQLWPAHTRNPPPLKEPPNVNQQAADTELAVFRAITYAETETELVKIWEKFQSMWTPEMTTRAAARKQLLRQLSTNGVTT